MPISNSNNYILVNYKHLFTPPNYSIQHHLSVSPLSSNLSSWTAHYPSGVLCIFQFLSFLEMSFPTSHVCILKSLSIIQTLLKCSHVLEAFLDPSPRMCISCVQFDYLITLLEGLEVPWGQKHISPISGVPVAVPYLVWKTYWLNENAARRKLSQGEAPMGILS